MLPFGTPWELAVGVGSAPFAKRLHLGARVIAAAGSDVRVAAALELTARMRGIE